MKAYSSLIVSGTFAIHFASAKQHVRGKIGKIDKNFNSTGYILVDHLKEKIENSNILPKTVIKDEPKPFKPFPPRADQIVNFGYNVFHGTTPEEQRFSLQGDRPQLFKLTYNSKWGDQSIDSEYSLYHQVNDFAAHQQCSSQSSSFGYTYAAGSAMLEAQAETNFDAKLMFSDDFFSKVKQTFGGDVLKLTTLKGVMAYGQAQASLNAFGKLEAGFEFSSQHSITQSLYSLSIGYESMRGEDWTDPLKQACKNLGSSPSTADILTFFNIFGTHGLDKAIFGMKVTSSMFMKGGLQASAYLSVLSDANIQAYLSGESDLGASAQLQINTNSELNGVYFSLSGREVKGGLKSSETSSYCGLRDALDNSSDPALLKWTFRAIWSMPIPSLSHEAKIIMQQVADDVLGASVDCMENSCSGFGLCAPNNEIWSTTSTTTLAGNLGLLWNGDKCFCFDGSSGGNCACLPDGERCTEDDTCRGCCSSAATQWAVYGGDYACGEEDILTDAEMIKLVQDRCVIRMWQWDKNKQGLARYQEWELGSGMEYLDLQGHLNGDDTMGFEIHCDKTCSGCVNGSPKKIAVEALQDICFKFGWSDHSSYDPYEYKLNCASTPGISEFNLRGSVGSDDSWFFEASIQGGNSPMHLFLRDKTAICPLMCDHNCERSETTYMGCIGFDHSSCNVIRGGDCQTSGGSQRLRINMHGTVNEDDRIGMMWYLRGDNDPINM